MICIEEKFYHLLAQDLKKEQVGKKIEAMMRGSEMMTESRMMKTIDLQLF